LPAKQILEDLLGSLVSQTKNNGLAFINEYFKKEIEVLSGRRMLPVEIGPS